MAAAAAHWDRVRHSSRYCDQAEQTVCASGVGGQTQGAVVLAANCDVRAHLRWVALT